jgi:hypothetical protein
MKNLEIAKVITFYLLLVEFTQIRGGKESYTYAICMYLLWIKKTAPPSIKKLNENIGRITGFIQKFSRKWQV